MVRISALNRHNPRFIADIFMALKSHVMSQIRLAYVDVLLYFFTVSEVRHCFSLASSHDQIVSKLFFIFLFLFKQAIVHALVVDIASPTL